MLMYSFVTASYMAEKSSFEEKNNKKPPAKCATRYSNSKALLW